MFHLTFELWQSSIQTKAIIFCVMNQIIVLKFETNFYKENKFEWYCIVMRIFYNIERGITVFSNQVDIVSPLMAGGNKKVIHT